MLRHCAHAQFALTAEALVLPVLGNISQYLFNTKLFGGTKNQQNPFQAKTHQADVKELGATEAGCQICCVVFHFPDPTVIRMPKGVYLPNLVALFYGCVFLLEEMNALLQTEGHQLSISVRILHSSRCIT